MPASIQSILELKEKLKPLTNTLDIIRQSGAAQAAATLNSDAFKFVNLNKQLSSLVYNPSKEFVSLEKNLFSIHGALDFAYEKNFASIYNYQSVLNHISTSALAEVNTSPLSEGFELYKLIYRNFAIPNFEELIEEEKEKEEERESFQFGESQISRIITDIYTDNSLFNRVESWEFEEVIAELLRSHGYKVEMTKRTRDGGFDLIALANLQGNIPFKALVECKRYKDKVGVGIIRSFKEVVMSNNANKGIIVTTGLFTSGAWKKQEQTPYLLDFKDKTAIVSWVEEYVKKRALR